MTLKSSDVVFEKTPKQPEDHKKPVEPYVWTSPDGDTVKLKPFGRLPFGLFRKSQDADDEKRTYMLIEAATDAAGLAVLDELPMEDVNGLFEGWAAASGVKLPQS